MAEENTGLDNEMKDLEVYEVAFHIDPHLSETNVRKTYDAVRQQIEQTATALIAESEPKRMSLAYTITHTQDGHKKNYNNAFFAWITYEGHPEQQAEITELLQENESIIRHLCVKTTKEAALFAQEREHEQKAVKQNTETEQEVSEEDLDNVVESVTV